MTSMSQTLDAYNYNGTLTDEMLIADALESLAEGIPKSIIFIVVSMAVGVASLSFCPRSVSVAFTFLLAFIVGRAAAECFPLTSIQDSMDDYTWISIGYVELIFILMPSLVFEAAYSLEVHDFRKYQFQIYALSFLCYFIGAGIFGLIIFLQMSIANMLSKTEYMDWPITKCLQYAAMASPLDPTSASTMLHHVGVPHHLYVLVKGDSILSNVAAVFTSNLFELLIRPGPRFGRNVAFVVGGLLICILIGYASGRLAALLLRNLTTDPIRENAFLVAFVYGTFGACKTFGAGILGTFVFALTLNAHRKWVNRDQFEMNKRIWTTMAYYSKCVIVILTGVTSSVYFDVNIYLHHAILIYLFGIISRACALIICTPIIRLLSGGRYPVQYSCFMMWSSVPGAVSMVMSWRTFESRSIFVDHLTPETKAQDLAMWLVGSSVALGHLIQGCTLGWLGRQLGLAGISRADREHLNEFVIRLNNRIKEKIAVRKALPRYAEADWSKIEKNASLRLENQKVLAAESIRSSPPPGVDDEENEWHARDALQRVYDVELSNMSHFGCLSQGLRRVQQAVAEATETHSRLRVEALIQDREPYSIWRRLFPTGGWNPRWLKMVLGERRSVWSDFWHLVCWTACTVQATTLVITLYNVSQNAVSNVGLFVSGIFSLFSSVEFVLRLWKQRKQLHQTYIQDNNAMDWLYLVTGPCQLVSLAMHNVIYLSCKNEENFYFVFGLTEKCPMEFRNALFGVSAIFWLSVPIEFLLIVRIICFELGHLWQNADEEIFEILNALIALSTKAMAELRDGELGSLDPYELRQRLIDENEAIKAESKQKLEDLYQRRGGSDVFLAIKTRRVAYDLLYDATQLFQTAKQCGELNESEYKMATEVVERLRNRVQQWTVEKCKKEPPSKGKKEPSIKAK